MKKGRTYSTKAILIQQVLTKGILFVPILLDAPQTLMYFLFAGVLLIDILFPLHQLRKVKIELNKVESVISSRLCDQNPETGSVEKPALILANHMAACQTSRDNTRRILREKKVHALEFSEKMKDSVYTTTRINGSVLSIHEKIEALNKDILNSLAAIEEITRTILSFGRQIEEQSSSVVQTSAAITEMDASISNVRGITEKKEDASKTLVNSTQEGKRQMEEMGQVINSINSNIDSVQEVIKVINDIATRTNLLSMNAAIEAAHAGESGKGFAVVAAEIRKLSESTGENAKLISKTLKAIIENIKSAKDLSLLNLDSFTRITHEASLMADAFREIHMATSELSAGSNEIVSATQLLNDVTTSIKEGSHEIALSSEEIRKSIQRIVEASKESAGETANIADVAQALNVIFLKVSEVFLKYEEAISEIRSFQEFEFEGKRKRQDFDVVSIMLQHLLWIIRARGVIDKKLDIDLSELVDHTTCRLGQWILNEAPEYVKKQDGFVRLEKEHETLHRLVREIVESRDTFKRDVLEDKYNDLLQHSEIILGELAKLERGRINPVPAT
ncbi:MAG TPA: methyl-accepting chemotaxis protein [Spirochaetales bacterium]|nr:methyl-accepting chemotaxis protein [Spirochaetales bacterium]